MPTFDAVVKTTELEAINELFAAIGEEPIAQAELDTPTLTETTIAIQVMKEVMREVLTEGWRFNSEWGKELPADSGSPYTINFADGTSLTINVFEPPTSPLMLSFRATLSPTQQSHPVDTEVRRSELPAIAPSKLVFWNREKNIDGFDSTVIKKLYIDWIFMVAFEDMPQEAIDYVTKRAARKFATRMTGDADSAQYTALDERMSWRVLRRRHGLKQRPNMFRNADTLSALGERPVPAGVTEDRHTSQRV